MIRELLTSSGSFHLYSYRIESLRRRKRHVLQDKWSDCSLIFLEHSLTNQPLSRGQHRVEGRESDRGFNLPSVQYHNILCAKSICIK